MSGAGDRPEDEIVRQDRTTTVLAVVGILVALMAWRFLADPMIRLVAATVITGLIVTLAYGGIRQLRNPPARSSRAELIASPGDLRGSRETESVADQAAPTTRMPPTTRMRWAAAQERHQAVLLAYLPYENEPLVALRYPVLTDVRDPDSAAFFDALYDAQALRTEEYPGDTFANDYIDSVRVLARAWATAERNARGIGISALADPDQQDISQAIKLLRHAEGVDGAERATYAERAYALLRRLIDRGVLSVPKQAMARIEAARRPELGG